MKTQKLIKFTRIFARGWSLLSLAFLMMFIFGELIFSNTEANFTSLELAAFLFFPIGVSLGLILAFWLEAWGGAFSLISLIIFYLTLGIGDGKMPRGPYFALFAAPALLFLLLAWLEKERSLI